MDHGDRRQHRNHPEYRRHHIEESSDNEKHQPLRALHKTDLAGADQRLGARPGVTHHDGTDHHQSRQDHVKKSSAAGVINQQAKEKRGIRVAVYHRIKETAEAGNLVAGAGHPPIHQIEKSRADDD